MVDVGHLVRFRVGTVRRRRAIPTTVATLVAITVAACTLPALLPGARDLDGRAHDVLLLLPTAFAASCCSTMVSAVASGGGRELLDRDHGVAYPVSPTTDHLGALLMAPLNIAWLIQALGAARAASRTAPPPGLCRPLSSCCSGWLAATALGQVVAWTIEAIRRVPTASHVVRGASWSAFGGAVLLQLTGQLVTCSTTSRPPPWCARPCTASPVAGRSRRSSWSVGSSSRSRSGRSPPTWPPVARRATRLRLESGTTRRADAAPSWAC